MYYLCPQRFILEALKTELTKAVEKTGWCALGFLERPLWLCKSQKGTATLFSKKGTKITGFFMHFDIYLETFLYKIL